MTAVAVTLCVCVSALLALMLVLRHLEKKPVAEVSREEFKRLSDAVQTLSLKAGLRL